MSDSQEIILTTCPRDCFDTCGIAVVKRHGVIAHVRGDPSTRSAVASCVPSVRLAIIVSGATPRPA